MTGITRCALVVLLCFPALAGADEWKYDDNYLATLLYLHELVDYAYSPTWNDRWETNLLKGNSVRLSFGSITTADLLSDVRSVINHDLGRGFRFLGDFWRYGSHHLDFEIESNWMGFEKRVLRPFHLLLLFNPATSKELIDARVGLLLADADRSRYLSVALRLDDFLYEAKNDRGGKSIQEPVGVQWLTRYVMGRWSLFSEGTYLRSFKRNYPDRSLSPEILYHQQRTNNFDIKLRYRTTDQAFFETSLCHYHLDDRQSGYTSAHDYSYQNEIAHGAFRYIFPLQIKSRVRLELHYVRQQSQAHGFRDYTFDRTEFLPAVFGEYILSANVVLELGYMGTAYDWDYDYRGDGIDYRASSYADKVKLGCVYRFNEGSRLQLSLSHEPRLKKFGGGNARYMMFF